MKIGELSRATEASPRSLRYYEQLGLISSQRRSNGYREYDEPTIETVATIKSLLGLGFPMALIEKVLPCTGGADAPVSDCSALTAHITQIRDEIDQKARHLLETRDTLTAFLQRSSAN
ncbi:MerR family transcriptional regulator [Winogradskya humida]|uniref:MerR family transcriptional regulator n=1 Tax=Winogradskya humida TaxID=113566 RepID=A0ABQ3ZYI6_9ACTN|nr:MerR family transcriptional regulator [Actinoplanes humidus]GIE23661.1 MerR family transcriptional regulator [Actinoplanes humidus]